MIEETPDTPEGASEDDSPWLTAREAGKRARCSHKLIYAAVRSGKLKAARLTSSRRAVRIHTEWLDAWISAAAESAIINPAAPGPVHPAPPQRGIPGPPMRWRGGLPRT